jgi:hypothetical protein
VRAEVRLFSVKTRGLLRLRDVLKLFGFVFFLCGSLVTLSKYVKCFSALNQELGASLRLQVKAFVLNIKFLKFSMLSSATTFKTDKGPRSHHMETLQLPTTRQVRVFPLQYSHHIPLFLGITNAKTMCTPREYEVSQISILSSDAIFKPDKDPRRITWRPCNCQLCKVRVVPL